MGAVIAGRYRLIKGPIRGGTGEVWLADDLELRRHVVLKRPKFGGSGPHAFKQLRAEARALARFTHPHVVTLYDAIQVRQFWRSTSWLVLEYVPGGSLDAWPPAPPQIAARIGAEIADALGSLHAAGIVHCDVKPGNIVMTEKRTVKLADFGAAYRLAGLETITQNGPVSHTPAYAAPEVVRGLPEPASDVYSLGATVYALVTGTPPGPNTGDELTAETRADAPPAEGVSEEVLAVAAGPLGEVLAAMLQAAPPDRPTPDEAQRMLDEIAGEAQLEPPDYAKETWPPDSSAPSGGSGGFGPVPGEPGERPSAWTRSAVLIRRHPRLLAAGAVLVAALIAFPFTPLNRDGDATPERTTPASLIGDPHTVDPCALLDPAVLGRFGGTELDVDYGNFDRCDVLVTMGGNGDGGEVDVEVDLEAEAAPETAGPLKTMGRVQVVQDPEEDDHCGRKLLLPSPDVGTTILVDAQHTDDKTGPLCAVADAAVAKAVAVLNHGPVPRRRAPFPAASLANRNACVLLGARALDIIPGIDAGDPKSGFGGWDCNWRSTTRRIFVKLRFDRGQPLGPRDGNPTRLRNHQAFVDPNGDGDGTCVVRVVHRKYPDQQGKEAIEMLYLKLEGDPPTKQLCSMATSLADAAAAQLPPP
ncbi:serine/threonine-protein kinase [Actinomadura terrae]|uniref:serine/threonine-protein kinase n=1 Tax=Actinomadura terrae TaxID=604353 RepID=UPI001FA6B06A|nr:serine/threonine-protein kinase [Actinomadura terrae]